MGQDLVARRFFSNKYFCSRYPKYINKFPPPCLVCTAIRSGISSCSSQIEIKSTSDTSGQSSSKRGFLTRTPKDRGSSKLDAIFAASSNVVSRKHGSWSGGISSITMVHLSKIYFRILRAQTKNCCCCEQTFVVFYCSVYCFSILFPENLIPRFHHRRMRYPQDIVAAPASV